MATAEEFDYSRVAIQRMENLDIEGEDAEECRELRQALADEVTRALSTSPGFQGLEAVVSRLHEVGHPLERRKTNEGWRSYFEETNGGARHLWIHANRDDGVDWVQVLYFETIESRVARRRAGLTEEERAAQERLDSFYERGLILADRYDEYDSLPEDEKVVLALYLLESGVNNGGFRTYITNTEGAHLEDAHRFLGLVGASEIEEIVRDVLALFPWGLSDGITEEIWDVLEDQHEELDALDERFYQAEESIAGLVMGWLEG